MSDIIIFEADAQQDGQHIGHLCAYRAGCHAEVSDIKFITL